MTAGCRPLDLTEQAAILQNLTPRDQVFFILGLRTGFRVSELLSLKVQDVMQYGTIVDRVTVSKRHMKGKHESRVVPLHSEAREALKAFLGSLTTGPLFPSTTHPERSISRIQAYRILRSAATKAKLQGKIGTHSMRKSFASRIYDLLDRDLVRTQKAMGHKSINSTVKYLSFKDEEVIEAILR